MVRRRFMVIELGLGMISAIWIISHLLVRPVSDA